MASRSLPSVALGLLVALATSCVVSPQPSPPDVIFDGSRLGLTPTIELLSSVVGFQAAPGTVSPAEGEVIVTNLDTTDAPERVLGAQRRQLHHRRPWHRRPDLPLPGQDRGSPLRALRPRGQPLRSRASSVVAERASLRGASIRALGRPRRRRRRALRSCCATSARTRCSPTLRAFVVASAASPSAPRRRSRSAPGEETTLTVRAGEGAEVEDVLLVDVTTPGAGAARRHA
jgi:hypothetical protein